MVIGGRRVKTKQYLINHSEGLQCIVEGPVRPALSTIYKRFCEEYGLLTKPYDGTDGSIFHHTISAIVEENEDARQKLRAEGWHCRTATKAKPYLQSVIGSGVEPQSGRGSIPLLTCYKHQPDLCSSTKCEIRLTPTQL